MFQISVADYITISNFTIFSLFLYTYFILQGFCYMEKLCEYLFTANICILSLFKTSIFNKNLTVAVPKMENQ